MARLPARPGLVFSLLSETEEMTNFQCVTIFADPWQVLGMAFYVAHEAARTTLRHHEMQSGSPRSPGMATQLFCRRMIEQAYHDCLQVGRDGRPTASAMEAFEWLSVRTDWTRHGIAAPPPQLRQEFYGTFDWACRWLGENPDTVREQGLTPPAPLIHVDRRTRRDWIRGLPDIKRRWEVRASRFRPF